MSVTDRAERLLAAALRAVPGAQERPGQRDMVLAVDTALPMIGLLRRKAERTIVDGALRGLKRRVEA